MVWLVINGISTLYGSEAQGLSALEQTLADRRRRQCTISPQDAPAFGVEFRVKHPGAGGFEVVYLTMDQPDAPLKSEQD